jgi:hypothetical protein
MASRRGRRTKSAVSRSSIGLARSLVTAISNICPMMELIGPMTGLLLAGSWSRITARRSAIS